MDQSEPQSHKEHKDLSLFFVVNKINAERIGLRLLENIVQLPVGHGVGHCFHLHTHLYLIFGDVAGNPAEHLVGPIVKQGNAVGHILLESDGGKRQLAESNQLAATGNIKPFHVAGQAMTAVGPGRKENRTTIQTLGTGNLSILKVRDEIIGFGYGGETHRAEFIKTVVDLSFFTHDYLPRMVTLP